MKKKKNKLDLEHKSKLKEINSQKNNKTKQIKDTIAKQTIIKLNKQKDNTQRNTKVKSNNNSNNQIEQEEIIEKSNQMVEEKIANNASRIKWKNIMTLIHNPKKLNTNLTCGENCTLRREASESEISSGETMSMHSGTDSQYERISPDMLSEIQEEEININENIRNSIPDNSNNEEKSPERMRDTQKNFQPQEINTYPDVNPDEAEEDNLNISQNEPDTMKKTSAGRRSPHEEDKPDDKTGTTCKKRKINKNGKIKIKNKLTPYYRKIKTRLQNYQIYFLKRHLKLLKSILTIKNNELTYQKTEDNLRNKMNILKTSYDMETSQMDCVQMKDQSQDTAKGGETTRDLNDQMIRDRTDSDTHNLDRHKERHSLTDIQGYNKVLEMEREEERLLKEFREKCRRRDNEILRKKARIDHLRQLIDDLPDSDEMPSEEERRIEEEIDKAQKIFNSRDDTKTIFRIMESVTDTKGTEVAEFNATVNFKTDPTRMRADNQTVLIALFIKNRELEIETRLLGDVDMNRVKSIQFKVPMLKKEETTGESQPDKNVSTVTKKITSQMSTKDVPTGEGDAPVILGPEEAIYQDWETTTSNTSVQGEEETTAIPEIPTPDDENIRRTSKRPKTQRARIYSETDSEEEKQKPKKKKTKKTVKKVTENTITPKTRAKDGRKLADVTNRVRDSRGRLL